VHDNLIVVVDIAHHVVTRDRVAAVGDFVVVHALHGLEQINLAGVDFLADFVNLVGRVVVACLLRLAAERVVQNLGENTG
jgi:hypothetical protein